MKVQQIVIPDMKNIYMKKGAPRNTNPPLDEKQQKAGRGVYVVII
jgi:hypothetical protein